MTEELFATDAYVRSCEATVREAGDEGVVLDRTVFYARSGGQPGDTGVLRWDGGELRVLDTVKRGGRLLHEVDGEPPDAGRRSRPRSTGTAATRSCARTPPCTRCRRSCSATTT